MNIIINVEEYDNSPTSAFALRNPWKTKLGKHIIQCAIQVIESNGYEHCTFKKIGTIIGSPESSLYRYFESKHKLLLFIMSLYWFALDKAYIDLLMRTKSPEDALKNVINLLSAPNNIVIEDSILDGDLLNNIVIIESSKAFLTKHVDEDNLEGAFLTLKAFASKIAHNILLINPDYPYSRALASTIIEIPLQQSHFSKHLPSLTEFKAINNNKNECSEWLLHLIMNTVKK